MTTLKELIYKILLDKPECRNSRSLIKWEVLKNKGFVSNDYNGEYVKLYKSDFIKWEKDTVRRCSQQLQREDLLLGQNKIQPTKLVKEKRVKLSQSKGYEFIQGQFNPETKTYEM